MGNECIIKKITLYPGQLIELFVVLGLSGPQIILSGVREDRPFDMVFMNCESQRLSRATFWQFIDDYRIQYTYHSSHILHRLSDQTQGPQLHYSVDSSVITLRSIATAKLAVLLTTPLLEYGLRPGGLLVQLAKKRFTVNSVRISSN